MCRGPAAGHSNWVTCLAAPSDSSMRLLLSGSDDGTLRLWNLAERRCVLAEYGHRAEVTAVQAWGGGPAMGLHRCAHGTTGPATAVSAAQSVRRGRPLTTVACCAYDRWWTPSVLTEACRRVFA